MTPELRARLLDQYRDEIAQWRLGEGSEVDTPDTSADIKHEDQPHVEMTPKQIGDMIMRLGAEVIKLRTGVKRAREVALREAAELIRQEWVCGCVEESPYDPSQWHQCCRYSEWAARNVESLITARTDD
jgi:hypothetical protein